jgi:D-aspartate ligase
MIKQVFILGNHIQALGLCRQISKVGVEVILFTNTKHSISRYSNSVKRSIIYKNEVDLLTKIISLKENSKTILLFPTNDQMVSFLSFHYISLSESFYIGIPEPKTADIFANKRNTYRFASKNNIPIPESYFPENINELKILSDKLIYPVIIKPAIMHSFHKIFGKKAFKCNSKEELIEKSNQIAERFPIEDLIIQEFLDGGAKTLYSYGTFAARGKAIASIMANRIRQNPMDFGNSTTYAITCNIPEIKELAEKILNLTDYFGLAEVEFMYDMKTDQYKFLEINTRAWKWHSISNGLGFSFIGKMISYFNENDLTEIKDFDQQIAWIERLTDTVVIIKELLKGNNLLKEVFKSYKIKKVYAVWSSKDILPFIMYLLLSPILFFKRH